MANTFAELEARFTADTSHFKRGVGDVKGGFDDVGKSATGAGAVMQGVLGANVVGAVFGALTGGVKGAVDTFATFEAKMSEVGAVSGETGAVFDAMKQKALDLGRDTAFSASQAASGLAELVKGGLDGATAMDAIGATLNLAAAGGTSLAHASEIAANTLNTFNLAGTDMVEVSNLIAGVANASSASVHDFGMSLAAGGAVAHGVGMQFKDFTYIIAAMGQQGIKNSDAGTALKSMLLQVASPTAAASALMRQYGISLFDAAGNIKDASAMAENLHTSLDGLTRQQQVDIISKVFGSDGGRAALILMDKSSEGIDKIKASMEGVTAEQTAILMMDNLKGSIEAMGGSAETLAIKIGAQLAPSLREGVKSVTEFLNQVGNSEPLLNFIGLVGDGIGEAVKVATGAITGVIGTITNVFGLLTSTGGDRAGFAEMLGFSEGDANKVGAVLDGLQGKVQAISGVFGSTGGERAGFFAQLGLDEAGANAAGALLDRLQGNFSAMIAGLSGAATTATPIIDGFAAAFAKIGEGTAAAIPGILQAAASAADALKAGLEGTQSALDTMKENWDALGPGMQAFIIGTAAAAAALAAIAVAVGVIAPALAALPAVLGLVALGMMGIATGIGAAVVAAAPFLVIAAAIAIAVGLLAAAWATNFGDIQGKTQAALEAVQTFAAAIQAQDWETAFSGLGTAAAMAGEMIGEKLGEAGQVVADAFRSASDGVAAFFDQLGSDAAAALAPVTAFGGEVAAVCQSVVGWFADTASGLGIMASSFLEYFGITSRTATDAQTGIGEALSAIGGFFDGLGTAVATVLDAAGSKLSEFGGWVSERMADAGAKTEGLGAVLKTWGDGVGSVMDAAGKKLEEFATAAGAAWAKVVEEAGKVVEGVKGKLGELATYLTGLATELGGLAMAVGIAIADGLTLGMASKLGAVMDAANKLGAAARQATADSVKAQSPSRLFYDIGQDIGQGLTDGISASMTQVALAAAALGEGTARGYGDGMDKEKGGALGAVQDWITALLRGASDAGVAGNNVWLAIGEGHAKAYVAGILSQQQGAIDDVLKTANVVTSQLNSALTDGVGALTVQQSRQVRDAVEGAATAQQKAIDAVAAAETKMAEAAALAGKKGHEEAVKAAQAASAAADLAVQNAAKTARKVEETTSDALRSNATAAEKANQKMADDAAKEAERAAKAIIAESQAAHDAFTGIMSGFGLKGKGPLGDDVRGVFRGLDVGGGLFDLMEPKVTSKHQKAMQLWIDEFKKQFGDGLKQMEVPMNFIDQGAKWKDALTKFGKEQGRALRGAISSELGGKTVAQQVVTGWTAMITSPETVGELDQGWSEVMGEFGASVSDVTVYTGEETGARFVTGFQKQFFKLGQDKWKILDDPMKRLVDKFEETAKKAGDALKDGVVRTIKELNSMPPIELDNLLPGGMHDKDAVGKPNLADPKSFNPFGQAQALAAQYGAMSDAQLRAVARPWLGANLPQQTSDSELMSPKMREWIIGLLIGLMQTMGGRGGLGEANPLGPEITAGSFAQRMATGWVGNRPTLAVVGDTRGDYEHVQPEARLRRVFREEASRLTGGPTYLLVDGEAIETRIVRRQNAKMARSW